MGRGPLTSGAIVPPPPSGVTTRIDEVPSTIILVGAGLRDGPPSRPAAELSGVDMHRVRCELDTPGSRVAAAHPLSLWMALAQVRPPQTLSERALFTGMLTELCRLLCPPRKLLKNPAL